MGGHVDADDDTEHRLGARLVDDVQEPPVDLFIHIWFISLFFLFFLFKKMLAWFGFAELGACVWCRACCWAAVSVVRGSCAGWGCGGTNTGGLLQ